MNGTSESRIQQEAAHDVLAAEAFAVPAPDPVLDHTHPVVLPDDPSGIAEAHDILAAEEFAMPAPGGGLSAEPGYGRRRARGLGVLAGALALGALLFRRRAR